MIKVAFVIPKYVDVGGAEVFARQLTKALSLQPDLELHVFANKRDKPVSGIFFHKVPIIRFPKWAQPLSFAWFAGKKISSAGIDIINSNERIFDIDIFTFHGIPHKTWVKEIRKKRMSLFDKATAAAEEKGFKNSRLRFVIAVSSIVKEEILKIYDIDESIIKVIHPGIAAERLKQHYSDKDRELMRLQYGINKDDLAVLFVSMNFEVKRLELVMQGIAEISKKRDAKEPAIKLFVVGKGNIEKYKSIAIKLNIEKQVLFTGVTKEVDKYYMASDVFAMPSKLDTFGIAVLEAMAASLPVIITETVGAKDLIDSGKQGFVLSKEPSVKEMSKALLELISHEKRIKMGEEARHTALQHTWDNVAEKTSALYRQVYKI